MKAHGCLHQESDGFHICGSCSFNLCKEDIVQGDLCDKHYWQKCALDAEKENEIMKVLLLAMGDWK